MRWLRHLSGRLPLRSAFLLFFIPATVLSVSLTAFASYKASVQVVSAQSKVLMGDTARQSARVVESSLRAVLTQMIALRYDPSFLSALEGELSPEPAVRRYEEIIGIRHRMEDIDATYSSLVESIFVRTGSGREFYYVPDQGPSGWSLDLDAWLRRDEANASGFGWLLAHDEDIFRTWEKRRVFSLFLRIGTPDTRLKAVAVFNLKESFFQDIFKGVDLSEHGYIVMLDRRGQPWYAREPAPGFALDPASVAALGRRDANAALRGAGGGKLLAASAQVPTSGWTLAVVVPERDFSRAMDRIEWISLGIMALMISVTSAFAVFFSASLTSPIRYLSGQTDRFVRGDLDTPFSLPDENEIGRLSRGLDSMATSVRSLLDQVKRDEDQRRAMELAVLQAQIQPHFVANTLSSVRHLVQLKDTERADEMLGALSRYFRNGLAGGRELVPLSQELEHTRDYLRIQKLRYDEAFSYEMEPLPSGLDPELPKITLQPLVENSLYHGIKDNGVFGTIRISVRTEGSCAVVEVRDDGAGMEAGRLEALRAGMDALEPGLGDAFGLRNVHQRLRRHFGPAAGLEVLSEPGNGTRVLVRLPLAPRGEGEGLMRIIIVDDDGIVREGLAKNIPWAEHGVEVVGTAKDGREGWLLVERAADVVLTDLRMPLLDGIGLAEKILAEKPGTKVVVLTGYDEFAYARKAVGAKVVDYILKWQDNAEILAAVLKAGAEAEAEEARERDARRSRLLAREDRWRGWLNGGAVAGADAELPLAVLSLACGPAGAAPRPAALRDLAYLLAERRGLRCAAAEFPESVAVCLESPASRENVASFAEELARGQARRWGEGRAPLVAFDEGPLAPRDAPTAWNRLEDLSKAARLAGRGGAVARDLMREWDNSPAALARKMKSLVDRDFARDSLSLVDAASEANLVPTYASTLFKKAQGIGFLEYLTSVRVDAARRLLAETDLPIGEIAFRVGLPNQRYFSSVFRKTAGVTPAAFRAEAQLLK